MCKQEAREEEMLQRKRERERGAGSGKANRRGRTTENKKGKSYGVFQKGVRSKRADMKEAEEPR